MGQIVHFKPCARELEADAVILNADLSVDLTTIESFDSVISLSADLKPKALVGFGKVRL